MKTLIVDNYDSFTFNLFQMIGCLGGNPAVHRNDKISLEDVRRERFTHIVLGPGPGNPQTPRDVGISNALLEYAMRERVPLLGVCLGHQIIGHRLGAKVVRAATPCHGAATPLLVLSPVSRLFTGLPETFDVMRYHSLCVEELDDPLIATAVASDGTLMAMEHESLPIFGVQFHPESIGTPLGAAMMKNFLAIS
ncbi:MAG TPA: aminodeoxychorismate/anthranilate synthase component II [Candidatus Peribacteria bacterium]|nr:aminodeoxychorismate/anthranilate synthase component II [Candidatus Peribacteria bacterium]